MIWNLVLALHLLAVMVWVGGMVFALQVLRPALAELAPAQRIALHRRVLRRFFFYVWHAMPIAVITGFALVFGRYGGFADAAWPVHAMSSLGLLMGVIFLVIFFGPWRALRAAPTDAQAALAVERVRRLVLLNMWLGLLTVVIGALAA